MSDQRQHQRHNGQPSASSQTRQKEYKSSTYDTPLTFPFINEPTGETEPLDKTVTTVKSLLQHLTVQRLRRSTVQEFLLYSGHNDVHGPRSVPATERGRFPTEECKCSPYSPLFFFPPTAEGTTGKAGASLTYWGPGARVSSTLKQDAIKTGLAVNTYLVKFPSRTPI
jgi:hypothetical protein